MKIVFFGTADIGAEILNSLAEHHQIQAVITSPDKPVGRKQLLTPSSISNAAEKIGLPILKPQKVKNNENLLQELSKLDADIFIVIAYGKILPKEIIELPRLKTINVHFSLLPKYRGASPVQFALLNDEVKTGSTIMLMDEELDHGPILESITTDISPDETNPQLQLRLAQLSIPLLLNTLDKFSKNEIKIQPQNHDLATFTKIIKKEDGLINWSKPAREIYNQWRAYQPWPGIHTSWHGKRIKILECTPSKQTFSSQPGSIENNLISCGNNTSLEIKTIQIEGKNPVDIQTFINGYPEFKNSTFN